MSDGALTILEPNTLADSLSGALLSDREPSVFAIEESEFRAETAIVGSFEREKAFVQCIEEIRNYVSLPTNWDTYGGCPADPSAVEFTLELLARLQVMPDISAPHVSPISGGIYLEWRFGDSVLYFEIEEGSILYMKYGPAGIREAGEECVFDLERAIHVIEHFHQPAA